MEELSTIPLNLKSIWNSNARLRQIFTGLFISTFIVIRLIYGTVIFLYTCRAIPKFIEMALHIGDYSSVVIILMQGTLCTIIRILNLYWTILIVRKARSMLRTDRRSALIDKKVLDEKSQ